MNFNAKEINSFNAARYGIERVEVVVDMSHETIYNFFFVGGNVVTATLDADKENFTIIE